MNPDLGPSSSPGTDINKALDGNQSLTSACSSSPHLFRYASDTGHETFCLSPIQNHTFAHHKSALWWQMPQRCWVGLGFLFTLGFPQACTWVSLSPLVCHGTGQNHASSSQRDHNSDQPPGTSGGSWLVQRCCGNPLEGLYTQILYAFI